MKKGPGGKARALETTDLYSFKYPSHPLAKSPDLHLKRSAR